MPPRRRTFYLADATLLSNPKVLRLKRLHPDDWLSVLGGFHLLISIFLHDHRDEKKSRL